MPGKPKPKYLVTYIDDNLCFFIIRRQQQGLFLLESLCNVLEWIYATGMLYTFDEEEENAKMMCELTEEELGNYKTFVYQEAALGYVARCMEEECRKEKDCK